MRSEDTHVQTDNGMRDVLTISVDAMGGDQGPDMVVPGLASAFARHDDLHAIVFGDRARVQPILDAHPELAGRCEFRHCEVAVSMNDKPSQALRRGRRVSSMWQAIDAVHKAEAQVAISAGNTGALMAMAKVVLRTMPGIERPAIAAIWPTLRGQSVVLDVGATIGAEAEQLVDFAIMGEAMARSLFGIQRPTVGLLNIGVEEIKGIEEVKMAGRLLRESSLPIEYCGFVEGDDIGKGTVDVVVTEGFSGNIALKAAEGTARQISAYLKKAMSQTMLSRIGYLLARGAFSALREKMDPRNSNGGMFLGLNGVVVKSHGGTDPIGFASAVDNAVKMVRNQVVDKISVDIAAKQSLLDQHAADTTGAAKAG